MKIGTKVKVNWQGAAVSSFKIGQEVVLKRLPDHDGWFDFEGVDKVTGENVCQYLTMDQIDPTTPTPQPE